MTPQVAARALAAGQVVAYPTEGVYGLGADPANEAAVSAIWTLKQRPAAMGLILIAADWSQLLPWMGALTPAQEQALRTSWPGPMTWVVPAAVGTPAWLTGGRETLALRWTAHEPAADLCRAFGGALVSTSANLHGQPPLSTAADIQAAFGAQTTVFAGVCDGALGGMERPTPIRDLQTGDWLRR